VRVDSKILLSVSFRRLCLMAASFVHLRKTRIKFGSALPVSWPREALGQANGRDLKLPSAMSSVVSSTRDGYRLKSCEGYRFWSEEPSRLEF
jgi:hypothetical protein